MSEQKKSILEMQNVEKHFGGVRAIDNFSLTLEEGQIHGLIGPNGAGKTTIFNNITGIYAPSAGKIFSTARKSPACRPTKLRSWESGVPSRTSDSFPIFPLLTT